MTTQTEVAIAALETALADTRKSVVRQSYKIAYAERAVQARGKKGVSKKVVADSCGDWLALELAAICRPDPKQPFDVGAFATILDANGVKHAHWNQTTKGWQGRFRMTGRLALQRVVADQTELSLPNGDTISAPKSWIAKHSA